MQHRAVQCIAYLVCSQAVYHATGALSKPTDLSHCAHSTSCTRYLTTFSTHPFDSLRQSPTMPSQIIQRAASCLLSRMPSILQRHANFVLKAAPPINTQARIQDSEGGGGFVHSEGGGGFVQEFQERIEIVAGFWANQQAKKNCRQP